MKHANTRRALLIVDMVHPLDFAGGASMTRARNAAALRLVGASLRIRTPVSRSL